MAEQTAQEEVKRGKLTTGREWHLVVCKKPDSNLIEGKHLVLECVGQPPYSSHSPTELQELRLLTFKLAEEFASEPGRWRVDFNGPGVGTGKGADGEFYFHTHIKLPAGKDKLTRLVG